MELNRRKYNWILFSLIILISIVIIFSAFDINTEEENIKTDNIDVSAEDDNSNSNNSSVVEIPDNKDYLPTAPAFTNGWSILNYAYKIKENYSFTSTASQVQKNDEVAGIVVTQYISEKKYKTNEGCLLNTVATCKSSEGINYSSYIYLNPAEQSVVKKLCHNTEFNFTNEPLQVFTKGEFINKYGFDVVNSYCIINSSNAKLDSMKRSGSNYVIQVTLDANVDGVFDNMSRFILTSAEGTRNFRGISATYTFTIDKKTGAFVSIKSVERYYIEKKVAVIGWQGSTITVTTTENYKFADINIDQLVSSTLAK